MFRILTFNFISTNFTIEANAVSDYFRIGISNASRNGSWKNHRYQDKSWRFVDKKIFQQFIFRILLFYFSLLFIRMSWPFFQQNKIVLKERGLKTASCGTVTKNESYDEVDSCDMDNDNQYVMRQSVVAAVIDDRTCHLCW